MHSRYLYDFIAIVLLMFSAIPVAAAPCPDDFDFVHFETAGRAILRVAQDQTSLLHDGPPSCRPDATLRTDEDGKPIPTVQTIGYDPTPVAPNLTQLGVTVLGEAANMLAAQSAAMHAQMNDNPVVDRTVGSGFVCLSLHFDLEPAVNCAIPNPFGDATPVIVTCDDRECGLINMPTPDGLSISAYWDHGSGSLASPFAAGEAATQMIARIHPFIADKIQK